MILPILLIVFSLLLLFFGAEGLVRGSSSLALRAGLSPLLVGLTIVAFGTSSPELVVSVKAALAQQGDISLGNVVGSNSFNVGIILGLTALICPIPVHRQIIKLDAPIALGIAFVLLLFLYDKTLNRIEGLIFFIGIVAYTLMNVLLARREANKGSAADTKSEAESLTGISNHWAIDVGFILGGLVILVFGSRLLVDNSIILAKAFGVSEAIIGLTIVAAGTSMPELATSVVAALRKQPDIAIGNVVGSNVFNILGILGVAALISPIHAPGISLVDYATMILFMVLLIPLLYTGQLLHRIEGVVLLMLYGVYLYILWPK
jgi:cation:H+ antiporter